MAGTTTETKSAPPVSPAEDELAEITMPAEMSMTLDDLVADDEPEAPAEEERKPEETKPEPVAVTPTPEPKAVDKPKGDPKKALREERDAHRKTKEKYRNVYAELEELKKKQAVEHRPGRPMPNEIKVAAPDIAGIATRAAESEVKGEGVKSTVEAILTDVQRISNDAALKAVAEADRLYLRRQEAEFVEDLALQDINFFGVLEEAGVLQGLKQDAQGVFADPILANRVWTSANPFKMAYRIATDKLKHEKKAEPEPADDEPETLIAATPTPAPKSAPTPDALAEAQRAGAREVVEAVAANAKRPGGVRIVRDAGQPAQVGMNLALWNKLDAFANRALASQAVADDFEAFMKANPRLNEFYMAGPPKA